MKLWRWLRSHFSARQLVLLPILLVVAGAAVAIPLVSNNYEASGGIRVTGCSDVVAGLNQISVSYAIRPVRVNRYLECEVTGPWLRTLVEFNSFSYPDNVTPPLNWLVAARSENLINLPTGQIPRPGFPDQRIWNLGETCRFPTDPTGRYSSYSDPWRQKTWSCDTTFSEPSSPTYPYPIVYRLWINFDLCAPLAYSANTAIASECAMREAKVFVGANSWKFKESTGVSLAITPFYSSGTERPIEGVKIKFGCGTPFATVIKLTDAQGVASITEVEAAGLGCGMGLTNDINAEFVEYLSSDGLPNKDSPMAPFYFPEFDIGHYQYYLGGIDVKVKAQAVLLDEQPRTKVIGYRPTIQGKFVNSSEEPVKDREVCLFYRASASPESCNISGSSIYTRTDSDGRFIFSGANIQTGQILISWAHYVRNRAVGNDKVYLLTKKDANNWETLDSFKYIDPTTFPLPGNPFQLFGDQGATHTYKCTVSCDLGRKIYQLAYDSRGDPSTNYHKDSSVACSSYVSTIMRRAGIMLQVEPSCSDLYDIVYRYAQQRKAKQILPPGPLRYKGYVPERPVNYLTDLQPGDIIFYWDSNHNRFGHTEIYAGNGQTIGNSSARGMITIGAIDENYGQAKGSERRYVGVAAFRLGCELITP